MSAGVSSLIPSPVPSHQSVPRLWLFRAMAVVGIPLLLLLGLECTLRLAGYGRDANFLMPDEQPGYYRTNPDFVSLFMPENFDLRPLNFRVAVRKPANTIRIVVLGESAAQGVPAPAFGFAPQLRAQLRARYPGQEIEVINTGIVAINSHVIRRIARELAGFSPDLFVVYVGNNEVVGPYGPGCTYLPAMPPLAVIRLSVFVRSTRTGQLLGRLMGRFRRAGPPPPEWGGMGMFADSAVAGDDPRLEKVYANFGANLADIARVATNAGAKTLLCTVVANLRDCPPLLSRHRAGLDADGLAAWQRAFDRGRLAWRLDETAAARPALEEARRLDPHHAETLFMLGSLELQAGDTAAARALLLEALHWDALRFRPDARINDEIRRVARSVPGVRLLDAAVLLGSDAASPRPPTGRELMFEHVHFDWEGNFQLARVMAQEIETALFASAPGTAPWLDSAGCAAAVGYTPQVRLSVLQHLATIVQHPPLTNQLSYVEDMARLARAMARAEADRNSPEIQRQSADAIREAVRRDPQDPFLAKLEAGLADDRGDVAGALAAIRRTRALQPADSTLAAQEAMLLSRLGHFDEAETLLRKTAATCPLRDLTLLAPAFADFFTHTKRFDEGRRHLDAWIALQPANTSLRLLRGRLAQLAGNQAAAETEFRDTLTADPGSQEALEALVGLLMETGRTAAAEQTSLAAAERQPRNQANNLRAALIAEKNHDEALVIRRLLAAERSGPVTPAIELRLARKVFQNGQPADALLHLAEARRLARMEGDATTEASIGQVIADLRAQLR